MMDENKSVHSDGCTCTSGKMHGHHYKHTLMKFLALCILLFIAFWFGVQTGEIKGALGITPFTESSMHMRTQTEPTMYQGQGTMMYGMQQ